MKHFGIHLTIIGGNLYKSIILLKYIKYCLNQWKDRACFCIGRSQKKKISYSQYHINNESYLLKYEFF